MKLLNKAQMAYQQGNNLFYAKVGIKLMIVTDRKGRANPGLVEFSP